MNNPISFPYLGIELDPVSMLSIGSLHIRLYGLLIGLGLILAVAYAWKRCKQFGIRQEDISDGVLYIVPFAIICARLYYCIFEWDKYAADPISVLYIWKGGLAIYGGVIGAIIGMAVFAHFKKIKLAALLDLVLLGFLIGQAIGRWGNFFNREAFGAYCDNFLAMRIPSINLHISADASEAFMEQVNLLQQEAAAGGYSGYLQVHPTFLYESLWNTAGFVLLHFLSKKRQYDGQIALGYALWYGLGRFLIEGLRMDSLYLGPIRVSQLLAGVTCFAASLLLFLFARKLHDPSKLFVNQVALRNAQAADEEAAEENSDEDVVEESPAEEESSTEE